MTTPTMIARAPARRAPIEHAADTLTLDVVVPVYNEEVDLGPCVRRLHAVVAGPARSTELVVLVTANLLATLLRFTLLRAWVFGHSGGERA